MKVDVRSLTRDPAWMAAFLSLLISTWIIVTDDLINSDGVLYIELASKFLDGEWRAALEQFSWPFYSLLIAAVSKTTFLGLETSAYLLNVIIQALLAFVFVRSAQALGGGNKVAWMAVILLLTNVTLNGYRAQIIRDFGYWAFFITAFLFYLHFYRTRFMKYAVGFSLSMIVATLFRIEGIAFVVAAPFIMLFQDGSWKRRIYNVFLLLSPLLLCGLLWLVYTIASGSLPEYVGRLNDPLNYIQNAYHNISIGISEKGRLLEDTILDQGSRDIGTESMFTILVMILIMKIISASGYLPLIFSLTGSFSSRVRSTITSFNIVTGFMYVNILILTTFTLSHGFLSPRYTMSMALLMTLLAAFGLADFFGNKFSANGDRVSAWQRRGKIIIIIMLTYMMLDGLTSFSSSKAYIRESGLWLRNNVEKDARLISNERTLYYYAGKNIDSNAISKVFYATRFSEVPSITRKNYDYLAVDIDRKQPGYDKKLIEWAGSQPIHRTENKRGDMVLIFSLKK